MLSKVLLAFSFAVALSLQVQGHALITPALGVKGKGVRNDVQRPSGDKPCGNIDFAKNLDTSTPVVAGADGSFALTVTNFNGGKDGSRQVAIKVNGAADGKNFANANVSKNGQNNPANTGSEQVTASLPPGTKCTGGKNKDLCLATVSTTAGFGNCVVIQQGGNGGANAPAKAARDESETRATDDNSSSGDTGADVSPRSGCKEEQEKRAVVGTRAPRYIRRAAGQS